MAVWLNSPIRSLTLGESIAEIWTRALCSKPIPTPVTVMGLVIVIP